MPSLLSQQEKDSYSAVFNDLHDTWARPIVYFKQSGKVLLYSNPDYNPFYDNEDTNENVVYTTTSGVIDARILYNKQQEKDYSTPLGGQNESFKYIAPDGFVRIKIRKEDWSIFEDIEDITFDDRHFENHKEERPHGLFTPQFYTLYLKIKK